MYKILVLYKMHTLSLSDFRARASEMLDRVANGETIRILRHGKPVAELVPVRPETVAIQPRWKLPVEPLHYLKPPGKTGAELIVEARESGW